MSTKSSANRCDNCVLPYKARATAAPSVWPSCTVGISAGTRTGRKCTGRCARKGRIVKVKLKGRYQERMKKGDNTFDLFEKVMNEYVICNIETY